MKKNFRIEIFKFTLLAFSFLFASKGYSQKEYRLICKKSNDIFIYNYSNNTFNKILSTRWYEDVKVKQSDSIIYLYPGFNDSIYAVNLNSKEIIKFNSEIVNRKIFLPVLLKNNIQKSDTGIFSLSYLGKPMISFSRFHDEGLFFAKGGNIYFLNKNDSIKFLKH